MLLPISLIRVDRRMLLYLIRSFDSFKLLIKLIWKMSNLTDALEVITGWLEQNQPELFASLQPGLSVSEIESQVEVLFPARLPTEVYELYQWKNGTLREGNPIRVQVDGVVCECDEGYFYTSFGSGRVLEAFSALYFRPLEFVGILRNDQVTLLDIFSKHEASFVRCNDPQQMISSLLYSEEEYYYGELYPSTTNLFLELAEAFMTDTIFVREGILSVDTQKAKALSQKYGKHYGELDDLGDLETVCDLVRLDDNSS
jgi:hypothetical protein